MSAKIVELIKTDCCRGTGIEGNPMRKVTQYYEKDGKLLWEEDPNSECVGETFTVRKGDLDPLVDAKYCKAVECLRKIADIRPGFDRRAAAVDCLEFLGESL